MDRGESATITVHVKNNDDKPQQITLKDPRGPNLGLFETFRFEPERITVMPHQTNSTQLYLTISKDTGTHSSFITFLGQSTTFGMRGLGFFIVVDREIDDYVDQSLRSGLPGGAFPHLNTEISETDAEKLIGSGFGIPKYLPSGYEFRGMDGSEDQQRFVYSPADINTETTRFSEFWNDEGLLIIYNVDGPNVNNTKSLPIKVAQDEGQQIMINGMMGDATEKQTRDVVESDITYDSPASVTFFDDVKKKSAHLRAKLPLDELFNIASSIPIYGEPNFAEANKGHKQGQVDYLPPSLSDIAPLKQFKVGISIEEIQCRDSLVLVTKHDGSPACIKPESRAGLVERDWIRSQLSFCGADGFDSKYTLNKSNSTHFWDENYCKWWPAGYDPSLHREEKEQLQMKKILDHCNRVSLGLETDQSYLQYENETHIITNDTCEWRKMHLR